MGVRTYKGCEFGNFRKFPPENFRKFIIIFPEISGNLLNIYFHFIRFNYDHVSSSSIANSCCKISTFLTNNSHALTVCIVLRKNNSFLARLREISANRMKIIDVITFMLLRIFLEISGNSEILNFRKFYNPSTDTKKFRLGVRYSWNIGLGLYLVTCNWSLSSVNLFHTDVTTRQRDRGLFFTTECNETVRLPNSARTHWEGVRILTLSAPKYLQLASRGGAPEKGKGGEGQKWRNEYQCWHNPEWALPEG